MRKDFGRRRFGAPPPLTKPLKNILHEIDEAGPNGVILFGEMDNLSNEVVVFPLARISVLDLPKITLGDYRAISS